jgi:DNA-binding transcriptional ArsR family regulator
VLRILFSSDDIARTRVANGADPVWELVLSLHLLQGRTHDPVMSGWRRDVTDTLRRDVTAGRLRLLFALNPPRGYFPDFLTPAGSGEGLEPGLDAIRSTPVTRLRQDLTILAADNVLPPTAASLARGDVETLTHLTDSMRAYREVAVAPYWTRIQAAVEADRGARARAFLDGGAEGLLQSLRPAMRWNAGVLEIPHYPVTRELHLDGRGLLLVPAYFCARTPVTLLDPALPPVLVYPVQRLGGLNLSDEAAPPADRENGREALAALLGRTRAAVLEVVDAGCSTGEVARRVGISPAAASQHATVLRKAGLLVTRRERNTVLHTLTPLGRAMLDH